MELWVAKLITIVLLLVISLTFGLLPVKLVQVLRRKQESLYCQWRETQARADLVISYLNCLAGGVFLGTSFLHLLPEVEEAVEDMLTQKGIESTFPVAPFVAGCGFFLIMILEHCVMQMQHHHSDVPYESVPGSDAGDLSGDEDTALIADTHKDRSAKGNKVSQERSSAKQVYGTVDGEQSKCDLIHDPDQKEPSLLHRVLHEQMENNISGDLSSKLGAVKVSESQDGCVHIVHQQHHQHHHDNDVRRLQGIRAFVLLLALSLHTVFEGLALGLQPSLALLWTLFGAIAFHKAIMAFTMGIQFAENIGKISRVIVFIVLFSFMAPLGIAIGTVIAHSSSTGQGSSTLVASVILQGIATGTFIYVTFFEVLQKEVGQDHNVLKVLAIIAGYGVIALTKLFLPD